MKMLIISIALAGFLFISVIHCSQNAVQASHLDKFSDVLANFENPPAAYRPAPLWVWHDRVSESMIDRDLHEFKDKGFGGVFIHPRYGLITEYLSDEWFDRVIYSVNKAKKLGLYAWIYDENSFPSGFAGGFVPAEMPESWNQGQGYTMMQATAIPDNVADYDIVLSGAPPCKDVSGTARPGDTGSFYLFKKEFYKKDKWHAGYSYVDLLAPGVTDKFIDATLGAYDRAVGDEFGATVPGVFSDEPNIAPPVRGSMRWTPALFNEFKKRRGYDLKQHLPAIFKPVGEWKRVRHDYYETLLELFIENWSKPIHNYTQKKNLLWTGHYWEHGWPSPYHGGDNMAMYAWHQMPAVDMLFNTMDQNHTQFGNVRAIKELRSSANQLGKHRTLSETYGAAGWELRFEDMKRLGDWEYVLGVNFMNQHLTYMNLTGDRKHDFPQGISYHEPWWKDYKVLNDYFARLSLALSSGEQINKILVLEPTTTTWMYYSPLRSDNRLDEIGDSFASFVEELERRHIEYDIGSENTIKDHGRVNGGEFIIGERCYDRVVLPPFYENIDDATLGLLREYAANGGQVLCFGEAPQRVNGKITDEVGRLAAVENWKHMQSIDAAAPLLADENFRMFKPMQISGDLFHQRRQLDDGQILFLVNSSLKEKSAGTLAIQGNSARRMNALSGALSPYPATVVGDEIQIDFELPPAGSLLLFINETVGDAAPSGNGMEQVLPATAPVIKRLSPNMLTLDYCNVDVADQHLKGVYFYTGGTKIWQAHGYKENPWVSSVQWKTELVDADTFKAGSGFEARYPFEVQPGVAMSSLRAVVEQPDLWVVQVNGQTIKPMPKEWAIDKTFGVFDIGPFVRPGKNDIAVIMHPMSIYAEIAPVYIIGDFDLVSKRQGWALTPAKPLQIGAWKKQGLPFYSYDVAYEKSVALSKGQKVKVRLGAWDGTVCEVHVNGAQAGVIGWPPYEVDISDFIRNGDNEIEVVVSGSLKNLLGPHHNVTRRGIVTPWSFKYAPKKQPAGMDYNQLDYGLFEDFEIIEIK